MDLFGKRDVTGSRPRIVLYSHDTMGLGHMRRNLLIAQSLANSALEANVLMIAGAFAANVFASSAGIDCLTLPALHKFGNGQYKSRNLNVELEEIIKFREKTICAATDAFYPDVLIVDNVPRGVHRELDSTLKLLKQRGKTRLVLGLRDVLDDPATVRREWQAANNEQTVGDYFDAVWVYGDPAVHNVVRAHDFSPKIEAKVRFTGYFDHRKRLEWAHKADCSVPISRQEARSGKRLALCLVGGGQDGSHVAEMFAKTILPEDYYGLLVTGPFMPAETCLRLRRIAADNPGLEVIKQISEPVQLLQAAHRVIAMGGYNTVGEVLSFRKHALVVPRVKPRQEQLIRAERLHELGLIDYIHPEQVTSAKLAQWLVRELEPLPAVDQLLDMNGLERLPLLLRELLDRSSQAQPSLAESTHFMEEINYVL